MIGGNLLGCATTLNLALVQEHDERKFGVSPEFDVTVFERGSTLGGEDLQSVCIEECNVEVGRYRTLPLVPGSYLADLVGAANGERGTVTILGKPRCIPGANCVKRGKPESVKVVKPWAKGTYNRQVRTFGALDWESDSYDLEHGGWPLVDMIRNVFQHDGWRWIFVVGFIWAVKRLSVLSDHGERAKALILAATMFGFSLLTPRRIIEMWHAQYTFWATTLSLILKHGLTAGISRGSVLGFFKLISDNNSKNRATCASSVGKLLAKTGLEPYFRGTGEDYTLKFKYNRSFVERYLAPVVALDYQGKSMEDINALACQLALLSGDFPNSDVAERLAQIVPSNATLCGALIEAAKANITVHVSLNTKICNITFDDGEQLYTLAGGNSLLAQFEAVVLCESPKDGEIIIDSPYGLPVAELLGYDRDLVLDEHTGLPAVTSASSHLAVVRGTASPSFFRFTHEKRIPDLVQVVNNEVFARFERVREISNKSAGIYVVHCSAQFKSSGLFDEMFDEGAVLEYFEPRVPSLLPCGPVNDGASPDSVSPHVVLGHRFVYAAAAWRLARHPEMVAMAAMNAASMFSYAVKWATPGDLGDYDGDDEVESDGEDSNSGVDAESNEI